MCYNSSSMIIISSFSTDGNASFPIRFDYIWFDSQKKIGQVSWCILELQL